MTCHRGYETLDHKGMGQDGHEPPKLGHLTALPALRERPKLSVILGGALIPSAVPEESIILRSSLSVEGRARLLRALRMLGAERAFLFVWDDQEFTLSEACVCDETGAEPRDRKVMWSLLDRITSQRTPLVMAGTDEQSTDAMMSGVTPPLRTAIAVPLILGDELRGVACFDKRIHKGQFVESDAMAAGAILSALQLDAAHLKSWSKEQEPALAVSAAEITQALLGALSPDRRSIRGLQIEDRLAAPSGGEAHFWACHELENGVLRLILGRLTSPVERADLVVTRLLAAFRSATLLKEAGLREQLHSMAFEIERAGSEPYALHTLVIDWCSRDGTCSLGKAGTGVVFERAADGTSKVWDGAARAFCQGVRETVSTTVALAIGTSLVCELGGSGTTPDDDLHLPISRWVITRET